MEVRHLLVQVVRLGLQLGHAPLQFRALAPDALELLPLLPNPRFAGGRWRLLCCRERRSRQGSDEHHPSCEAHQIFRRWRPTENELPTTPMSAPAMSPSTISPREK